MISTIVTVISLCTVLTMKSVTGQSCTPPDYPPFLDRHVEFNNIDPFQVPHPLRFLITSFHFGCRGNVTEWALFTVNSGAHPIEFQVWRADTFISNTFTLNLVGVNSFPEAKPDSDNLLSLSVPQEQQIQVEPGDILGISTFSGQENSTDDFRIQDYILMGTIMLYTLDGDSVSTPQSLPFQSVSARFSLLHYLPVMNVTVVPTIEDNMEGGPQVSSSLPQSAIIALSTSTGILSLLSLIFFIAVVALCCCCTRNRKSTKHPKPPEHSAVDLDENPAYNDGSYSSHDYHHQSEPYYSFVTEDSRDSYVEIQPSGVANQHK